MGTIVKRGESWRVVIRKKGHPTITKTFAKMVLARKWMQETEMAIERKEVVTMDTTVGDLIGRYLAEVMPSRNPAACTINQYRQIERWANKMKLSDVNADYLIKWKMEHCPKASPVSFSRYLSVIWTVLHDAEAFWGINIPAAEMRRTRKILRRTGNLSNVTARDRRPQGDEVERIKRSANTTLPLSDIVDFAVITGMRAGEITRLRWDDLDEEQKLVLVRDRKHPTKKIGNHSKVPLLKDSFDIVMRQPRTSEFIFPYKERSVCAAWSRARDAAGVENLTFHDLRHEAISRMFERGFTIPEVAMVSGHHSWGNLKIYTNLKPQSLHNKG